MRPAAQSPIDARHAEMFPVLALSEIGRISRLGERRAYPAGARIFSTGEIAPGAFVLLSGQVDIMQRVGDRDAELIVSHGPGSFMGELAQLSGRPALVDGVARGPVEVLVIPQRRLRDLLVEEAELGERIMRALILRRVASCGAAGAARSSSAAPTMPMCCGWRAFSIATDIRTKGSTRASTRAPKL